MGLPFSVQDLFSNVVMSVISEIVIVALGVLVGHFVLDRWEGFLYGGWHVVVRRGDRVTLRRAISAPKAKEILTEPAELSVFLKGVISPYERIRCDLLEEGRKIGLLVEDRKGKQFVIDLDKNAACAQESALQAEDEEVL